MSDTEKVSVETLPLTKAFMQDLYDKFNAAYAAYNTYRSVVDAAELYMPHLEINPEPRPWVGLTDDEIDRLEDAIDPAMYRVFARRVEQLLKEKNS
jgi:hypothetical protein